MGGRSLARQLELARGRMRQHGRADAGHPTDGGSREGGWLGSSSHGGRARAGGREEVVSERRSSEYRKVSICGFLPSLLPLCLLVAEAGRSCGNPGGWMEAGISNGCGKVRGRVVVARSFPHPVSFHSLSGGKPRLPWQLQGVAHGPDQACVRAYVAACGLACGFARPDSAAPTPLRPLRIGSLADGELRRAERNLGKYWSEHLKSSHCASDGLESEPTALCRARDHKVIGRTRIGW